MAVRNVVFVTVGTSATREEMGDVPEDWGDLRDRLRNFKKDTKGRRAGELKLTSTEDVFRKVVAAHQETWRQGPQHVFAQPELTSAEMTSTWLLAHDKSSGVGGSFRPDADRIVLLSSDTADGFFCAHVNAALMHERFLNPVCTCPVDFSKASGENTCPAVRIEVVQGMEAHGGLAGILPALREICEREAREFDGVLFNITGGFKGAIPALTWLATSVLNRKQPGMYYQYEDVRTAMRIEFREAPAEQPQEHILIIPGD